MEWDGSWKKLTVKGLFKLTSVAFHQLQMTFWNLPTAAARKVVVDMSQTYKFKHLHKHHVVVKLECSAQNYVRVGCQNVEDESALSDDEETDSDDEG